MKRVFIWGTGTISKQTMKDFAEYIEGNFEILGFLDNDNLKIGSRFLGKKVYSSSALYDEKFDYIVILTDSYDEIFAQIKKMNPNWEMLCRNKMFFIETAILNRYINSDDKEIAEILEYIKTHGIQIFNYEWMNQYKALNVDVQYDNESKLYYVIHKEAPMFFGNQIKSKKEAIEYYRGIMAEQDIRSPHRYLSGTFQVPEGAVVVDAGVAEGNFSIEIIDKISKLYIIECDETWIEALKKTFKKYLDKIIFIHKKITSYDDGIYAKLDSLISEPVDFIKMDIEGNECDALLGANKLIMNSPNLQCAICSYHREYDERLIRGILGEYGMSCYTTKGYMWFPRISLDIPMISTKLVRGVIRGFRR